MNEIFEKVVKFIEDEFNIIDVNMNNTFYELYMDELDIADLFLLIEDEFGIEFSDEEFDSVKSIDELVNLINEKKTF